MKNEHCRVYRAQINVCLHYINLGNFNRILHTEKTKDKFDINCGRPICQEAQINLLLSHGKYCFAKKLPRFEHKFSIFHGYSEFL